MRTVQINGVRFQLYGGWCGWAAATRNQYGRQIGSGCMSRKAVLRWCHRTADEIRATTHKDGEAAG